MSRVGEALGRKFGPLPAWAWAGVALVAVILYRRYKAQQGGTPAVVSPLSPVGQVQSDQTPQPPVTLGPGESVYDPNTGSLLNGQPTDSSQGEPGPPGPPGPAGRPAPKVRPPKRRAKPKPKPKGAKPPSRHKPIPRKRAGATVRKILTRKAIGSARSKVSKPHTVVKMSTAAIPERGRATMPPQTALRQRPTPLRAMDHSQQKAVKGPQVHAIAPPHVAPPPQSRKASPPKHRGKK